MLEFSSRIEKKLYLYTKKALDEFNLVTRNDRIMLCLSGGKDSFTMLSIMKKLSVTYRLPFEIFAFTLDQSQPGWDDSQLRQWLESRDIPYEILKRNTYAVVKEKIPEGKTYCSLCSRLRRGHIYAYAHQQGFDKVALGHHRTDAIVSFLMSIFYNGQTASMPPKLLSDDKKHILIRPLILCQEEDIIRYAKEQNFPIIPCNLCGSQENLARVKVKKLIAELKKENMKIPHNIFHAMQHIAPSQLMDKKLWDFSGLEKED